MLRRQRLLAAGPWGPRRRRRLPGIPVVLPLAHSTLASAAHGSPWTTQPLAQAPLALGWRRGRITFGLLLCMLGAVLSTACLALWVASLPALLHAPVLTRVLVLLLMPPRRTAEPRPAGGGRPLLVPRTALRPLASQRWCLGRAPPTC